MTEPSPLANALADDIRRMVTEGSAGMVRAVLEGLGDSMRARAGTWPPEITANEAWALALAMVESLTKSMPETIMRVRAGKEPNNG